MMFRARLFWLGRTPARAGSRYLLKLLTGRYEARIERIESVIDTGDLSAAAGRGPRPQPGRRGRHPHALDRPARCL